MSQDGSYLSRDARLHPNVTIRDNYTRGARDAELQKLIRKRRRIEKKVDEQAFHLENLVSAAEVAYVVNEELETLEDLLDSLESTHQRLVTMLGVEDQAYNAWA